MKITSVVMLSYSVYFTVALTGLHFYDTVKEKLKPVKEKNLRRKNNVFINEKKENTTYAN